MCYVYVIYSSSLKKYYAGSSEDVERRLSQHNSGRGNFTAKGIPWIVVAKMECVDRKEAYKLEVKIKKRGISRYLNDNNFGKFGE